MTNYVILRLDSETSSWKEHGEATATSPQRAIRAIENGAGVYTAVPARSWKPVTVTVETKTVVKLG